MQKLKKYCFGRDSTVGASVEGVFVERKISLDVQGLITENGWMMDTPQKWEV